mgnify:CR=1 FL=1
MRYFVYQLSHGQELEAYCIGDVEADTMQDACIKAKKRFSVHDFCKRDYGIIRREKIEKKR